MQEVLGAERPGGEDDLARTEHAAAPAEPGAGADGVHLVPAIGVRAHGGDRGQGVDFGAALLREVQVILDQGVLGVVAATGHAGAALQA